VAQSLITNLGLEKGDRIGIYSPNSAEWTLLQFAAARAGLILVNVNPAFRGDELGYCLKKVGVKTLVMPPTFKKSNYINNVKEIIDLPKSAHDLIDSKEFPELKHVVLFGAEE